jgi:hypothetical protein
MKGLYVNVMVDADGSDCSNRGITYHKTNLLLVDTKLKDGLYEPKEGEPYLTLVRRQIRMGEPEYIHAVPTVNGVPKKNTMFGGNFVYSSDSRFSNVNRYPIPVHDRVETSFE